MEEITFSIFNHGQDASDTLRTLLDRFEQQYGIHVHLEVIPSWSIGWSRLVENALYRSGPDISEIGNTWTGDFIRIDSLHAFEPAEAVEITKEARIFENLWTSRIRDERGNSLIYSIPWTGDARAIFYRKELLDKAGIKEENAFKDITQIDKSLINLKENGISAPLVIPTRRSTLTTQYIASWVWSAGGDFLSPNGVNLAFNLSNAKDGCKKYFRLGRVLTEETRNIGEDEAIQLFRSGIAAVTFSGFWMLDPEQMVPEIRENIRVTSMPGIPFVGGQDLIVWKHSRHTEAAIKLIRFIYSEETNKAMFPVFGLPVSESVWMNPPFNGESYSIFKKAIQSGRGFHGQLWGLVEKRLTDVFAEIWTEIFHSSIHDVDEIVEKNVDNLANRLQLSLNSSVA